MKNLSKLNFVILIFLILTSLIYTQEISKIIILGESVGTTLDAGERDEYSIFSRFGDDFKSAIFFLAPDSNFYCRVTFKSDNTERDSTFGLSYISIKTIAARIQYRENLQTEFNIENVVLKYADGRSIEEATPSLANYAIAQDLVPLYKRNLPTQKLDLDHRALLGRNVRFGLSAGMVLNTVNFDGLLKIVNLIEEKIPEEGYTIPKTEGDFSASTLIRFSSFFLIKDRFTGEIEYAFNIHREDYHNPDYKYFSVLFGYQFPLNSSFTPYIKLGFTSIYFGFERFYNLIQVNSNGARLEAITVDGNAKGFKVSGGTLLNLTYSFGINLFIEYNSLSNIKVVNSHYTGSTVSPSVNIDNFTFGFSLLIRN